MLTDIFDNEEMNEIFLKASNLLCNCCSNCNTTEISRNIKGLAEQNTATGHSISAVTAVTDRDENYSQLPLLNTAQLTDFDSEIKKVTDFISKSYPASDCLEWIQKNCQGHWHLINLAEREIDQACLFKDAKRLTESLKSYESLFLKVFNEYRDSRLNAFTCHWCGSTDFWQGHGRKICRKCHPPAPGAEKVTLINRGK